MKEAIDHFVNKYSTDLLGLIKTPFLDYWEPREVEVGEDNAKETFFRVGNSVTIPPNQLSSKIYSSDQDFESEMYELLGLDKLKRFIEAIGFASLVYRDRFLALNPLLMRESNFNQGKDVSYCATKRVEEIDGNLLDGDRKVLDQSVKFGTLSASSKLFDDKTTLILSEDLNNPIDEENVLVNESPIGLLEVSLGDSPEYNSGWLRWNDRPDPPLPPYYIFQWGINFRFRPLTLQS